MRRRDLVGGATMFFFAGCSGLLHSSNESYDGEISVTNRTCGEVSQSGTGEVIDQVLTLQGEIGVEDVCQSLSYSVLTTANSRSPNKIYVDISTMDHDIEGCDSCRGTLNYSGEIEIGEDIELIVITHVADGENTTVDQVELGNES